MKWFKHSTDASDDVKIVRLEEKFGNDGYAVFFKCLEIVGKEGEKGRISFRKFPKNLFHRKTNVSAEKFEEILDFMGITHLCCYKSLKRDVLYFPKFKDRADNYSKYIKRDFEDTSNNGQENKNIEEEKKKIRKEQIDTVVREYVSTKGYDTATFNHSDWCRHQRAAKELLLKAGGETETATAAVRWMNDKDYEWTLETVCKKYQDFQKTASKDKEFRELETMYRSLK